MKPKNKTVRHLTPIALAFAGFSTQFAHATSDIWTGSTSALWSTRGNWSTNPATVPGTGDTATFNGAGNNNTTIDLGAGVTLGTLLFDTSSAAAYTIGSGAVGSQTLTLGTLAGGIQMNSTVAANELINANLALSTTGTYTIGLTNNSTTNTLTVAGGISASTAGAKTLTVTGSGNTTVSGAITNGTGQMLLTKTGTGTLTLSGANTYTGGTRANAGTTVLSGSHAHSGSDFISVNNVGAQNAVLKITSGAGTQAYLDINLAEVTNARGAIYQQGGTFSSAGGIGLRVGSGATSYGYYNLSGGSLSIGANDTAIGYGNGSTGVMDVTGGSMTAASWIVLGRNGGTASGLLNVTGGSVTSNSNNIALNWAGSSGALSILNVGGGAGAATVTGVSNAANYLDVSVANVAGQTGVVNVRPNGTLTVAQVRVSGANSTALFNFNGGTLKATAANAGANFMNDADMDAVTVYSGGGTIDNNTTNITIGNVLRAATGNGITSIAVTDGGSGYIGAPMVKITGGTGNTATGYAVMTDDGTGNGTYKISSIVVTSPGTYTVDPTTVTLVGGGATTAATIGAISTGTNTSGGMTFSGASITTLSGVNTYTGATNISGGTLKLASTGSIDNTSGVSLGTGGTFDVSAKVGGYTVNNLIGSGNVTGPLTVSTQLAIGNSPGTVNFSSDLTLGASSIYSYELTGGGSTADLADVAGALTITSGAILDLVQLGTYTANDKFTLFAYDGALSGTFTGLADDTVFTDAGGEWMINYNDTTAGLNGGVGTSYVTVTAIPEPGAVLLGGIGMLVLLRRRRN